MNAILNKMIRDKQPEVVLEAARSQAELKKAISGTDDVDDIDDIRSTIDLPHIKFFLRDANKTITELETILKKGAPMSDEDLQSYTIYVHGIKTALISIGKPDISEMALNLEILAKAENIRAILADTAPLLEALRNIVKELTPKESDYPEKDDDPLYLQETLADIVKACEEYHPRAADELIEQLRAKAWSKPTKILLDTLAELLLASDFEGIIETTGKFLEDNK